MKAVKDKIRFALWLKPETMEKVRTASAQDDCGSLSEFIVAESDHRHASMLFKLSVEMAMLMNIVAATQDILPTKSPVLRGDGLPLPPRAEQQGRYLLSVHSDRFPRHGSVRSHRQACHPRPRRRQLAAKRTPSPKKRGKEQQSVSAEALKTGRTSAENGLSQKTIFLPRRNSADPLTPAPVHPERGKGRNHLKGYGWGNMNHL